MPIGGLLGSDTGWWLNPTNRMDGVTPDLFADPTGMRYMLNQREVTAADIFALSSAAGKTYIDASGVLRTAGLNELRVDYLYGVPEILYEGSSGNVLLYTEDLTNAYWTKQGCTPFANVTNAPNLELTADNLVEDTSTGIHGITRINIQSVSSGQFWSAGILAKPNGRNRLRLQFGHSGRSYRVLFNLTGNGSVVGSDAATGQIFPLIDGWYLCMITAQLSGGTLPSNIFFEAQMAIESSTAISVAYTGDGVSGMYLWGTQLENNQILTSYMAGGASAATRTADIIPLTVAARNIFLASAGAAAWRGICPIRNATIFISKGSVRMLGPTSSATAVQTQPIDLTANAGTGDWTNGAGACVSWGASGRRLAMGGGTVVEDANPIATGATIHLGNSTGIPSGQVLRLRQLVGWTLADRASAAAVQAQARVA